MENKDYIQGTYLQYRHLDAIIEQQGDSGDFREYMLRDMWRTIKATWAQDAGIEP